MSERGTSFKIKCLNKMYLLQIAAFLPGGGLVNKLLPALKIAKSTSQKYFKYHFGHCNQLSPGRVPGAN